MAKAVDFREFTPVNSRDDLIRRIEQAPVEHAEAMLGTYDLLQELYDKGIIDLLRGLLSAGDTVVEKLTDVVSSKEAVNALRMVLVLGNVLTSINPDALEAVISSAGKNTPPSLLSIGKQAASEDARRGMAVAVGLMSVLGAALNRGKASKAEG
jgi:uncharacterized protein YjgD (DUF1641 family)